MRKFFFILLALLMVIIPMSARKPRKQQVTVYEYRLVPVTYTIEQPRQPKKTKKNRKTSTTSKTSKTSTTSTTTQRPQAFTFSWRSDSLPAICTPDSATFTAAVPDTASIGTPFRLTLTYSGTNAQFTLPELEGLKVVGTSSSQQSSMQWINGEQSCTTQQQWIYYLQADTAGTYTIPALTLTSHNQTCSTQPLTIIVH